MFTDEIIESMVKTLIMPGANDRDRHLYRESLRALVRLAKVEQMGLTQQAVRQAEYAVKH